MQTSLGLGDAARVSGECGTSARQTTVTPDRRKVWTGRASVVNVSGHTRHEKSHGGHFTTPTGEETQLPVWPPEASLRMTNFASKPVKTWCGQILLREAVLFPKMDRTGADTCRFSRPLSVRGAARLRRRSCDLA